MIIKHWKILAIALLGFSCVQHKKAPVVKFNLCISPQWLPLGKGLDGDPFVQSMLEYRGQLYVTGRFENSGKIRLKNIARWDGMKWDSLGAGTDEFTHALCVYNNELYVTGEFKKAGGISANKIAKWNGVKWDTLNGGMDWSANALAVYNGKLYLGGIFEVAGNRPVQSLATWDGKEWSSVGEELIGNAVMDEGPGPDIGKWFRARPSVSSLVKYNGSLYVAGYFKRAGKLIVNNIARWNDTNWSALSNGINDSDGEVNAMVVYNGNLIVAGKFDKIDGKRMNNIAMWDGVNWHALDSGITGEWKPDITSMLVYNGELYVAGQFNKAGNRHIKCGLATWNGKEWQSVGQETYSLWDGHGHIDGLAIYNNVLYAGGLFEKANGYVVNNIARFTCIDSTVKDINNGGGSNQHSVTFGQK